MAAPSHLFHVTVINLSRDARTAIRDGGPIELGNLSADALITLLDAFTEIDPSENLKADCELRVQNRRNRFIVRTEARRLMLHDARNPHEPAYVLSAPEIVAELDGSAAAKRTTPPIPLAIGTAAAAASAADDGPPVLVPRVETPPRPPIVLAIVVLLLAGYLGYSVWTDRSRSDPAAAELTALTLSERQTEDAALVGVYTTGSEPGQHGIIILGDGNLKLFRANAQGMPSVVVGRYQLGRLGAKLHLATDQPGGAIKVVDRESLEFCGEIFKRVP